MWARTKVASSSVYVRRGENLKHFKMYTICKCRHSLVSAVQFVVFQIVKEDEIESYDLDGQLCDVLPSVSDKTNKQTARYDSTTAIIKVFNNSRFRCVFL